MKARWPVARRNRRKSPGAYGLVLLLVCLAAAPLHAQDWMTGFSPRPGFGTPMGQSALPSLPPSSNGGPPAWPDFAKPYGEQLRDTWPMPYGSHSKTRPDSSFGDDDQPDLTGIWRGSGGETVEILQNRARIWSGGKQPCQCRFFLVGKRLIAYSPDTDMVRKYWFLDGVHRFSLIDEAGNLMSFQRTR